MRIVSYRPDSFTRIKLSCFPLRYTLSFRNLEKSYESYLFPSLTSDYTHIFLIPIAHQYTTHIKMGAQISSDGRERTVLARMIDPNGLLLEQTEGWESGTITQAAERLKSIQPTEIQSPQHVSQLTIDMGADDEQASRDFPAEKKVSKPTAPQVESILDTQMSKIAPPVLVRWMSSNSSTSSSGEDIYERRRSRSIGSEEGQNLASALHRRAKSMSMSGYADQLDIL